jgi:hypothetical protein
MYEAAQAAETPAEDTETSEDDKAKDKKTAKEDEPIEGEVVDDKKDGK